jgi:hypothetical protein
LTAAPIQGLQDEVFQLGLAVLNGATKRRGLAAVLLRVGVKRVEAFAHFGLEACDLLAQGVDGFAMCVDLDLGIADPPGERTHRGQHGSVVGTVGFQRRHARFEVGKRGHGHDPSRRRPARGRPCLNGELDVRPIRHRLADRVRAHMFLRMLSYYISWHMKAALAPILFQDNDKPAAAAKRANPVAPAQRSNEALTKAARKRTDDNTPVHSFTSLLADLATICANQIQPADDMPTFTKITTPTPLQRRAFELLAVSHRLGYT